MQRALGNIFGDYTRSVRVASGSGHAIVRHSFWLDD